MFIEQHAHSLIRPLQGRTTLWQNLGYKHAIPSGSKQGKQGLQSRLYLHKKSIEKLYLGLISLQLF